MTNGFVDLHCHSTASDGTLAPADVVRLAQQRNLSALSLTDHDTVGGIDEAAAEAARLGIAFLPGIEPTRPALGDMRRQLLEGRDNRNPKIIEKLQQLGVSITMEEVEREAKTVEAAAEGKRKPVGRPHIAAILLRKGYVSSIKQAFDKYLAQGGAAYFDKERLTMRQAMDLIRQSGGMPVLAHPVQLRTASDAELDRAVKDLVDLGLVGLETIHSDHDAALVEKYTRL